MKDELKKHSVLCFFFFRDAVKRAFQPAPKKVPRMNSTDCSYEVEDDMLPWLLEDLTEEAAIVSSQ